MKIVVSNLRWVPFHFGLPLSLLNILPLPGQWKYGGDHLGRIVPRLLFQAKLNLTFLTSALFFFGLHPPTICTCNQYIQPIISRECERGHSDSPPRWEIDCSTSLRRARRRECITTLPWDEIRCIALQSEQVGITPSRMTR